MSTPDRAAAAHDRGYKARGDGTPYSGNPYSMSQSPRDRAAWSDGWNLADQHITEAGEENKRRLMDAVRWAAADMPEGPMSRFADAVIAWMEEREE